MKILGPLLILLAFSIITFLTYQFFGMILPLLNHPTYSLYWCFHCFTALFLLFNVCYNYVYCVATRHTGAKYAAVCRELAIATNYDYPETEAELKQKEQDFEQKFVEAYRNRNRSRTNDTDDETDADVDADAAPPPRNYTTQSPTEWSFCRRTKQPKAPRSHFDHVTKNQVLTMDHFCPWMANVVGYFNYRFFLNFLIYVDAAMLYGICVTYKFFMLDNPRAAHKFQHDLTPELLEMEKIRISALPHLNHHERSTVSERCEPASPQLTSKKIHNLTDTSLARRR